MYLTIKGCHDKELYQVAVSSIRTSLQSCKVNLPDDFEETLFDSSTPHTDVVPIINSINLTNTGGQTRVAMELSALKAVHAKWMEIYIRLFPESDKRFLWMPFELIGLNPIIDQWSGFVEPILSLLLISPDRRSLSASYNATQDLYRRGRQINSREELIDYLVRRGVWCNIDGKEHQAIVFDRLAAAGIASQLTQHNDYGF